MTWIRASVARIHQDSPFSVGVRDRLRGLNQIAWRPGLLLRSLAILRVAVVNGWHEGRDHGSRRSPWHGRPQVPNPVPDSVAGYARVLVQVARADCMTTSQLEHLEKILRSECSVCDSPASSRGICSPRPTRAPRLDRRSRATTASRSRPADAWSRHRFGWIGSSAGRGKRRRRLPGRAARLTHRLRHSSAHAPGTRG